MSFRTVPEEDRANLISSLHDLNLDEQVFYSMKFDIGPSRMVDMDYMAPLTSFLWHKPLPSILKPPTLLPRICPLQNRKCEGPINNQTTIPYSRSQLFRQFWDSSGIFIVQNTDTGPSYLFNIDLDFLNLDPVQTESFFTRQGMFYSVLIGQNDETPHCLYGPLPIASVPSHLALVYLFESVDEEIMDLRSLGQTYVIVAFLFDKQLEEYLPKRTILQGIFDDIFKPITTVDLLDTRLLAKLKTKIVLCTICANYPFHRLE